LQVYFYEAFEEEERALRSSLGSHIAAGFTWKTVQEQGDSGPPAPLISIRTQSILPTAWATRVSGILARSTGYDHLQDYVRCCSEPVPCGYLPLYCARSVAEQALLLIMALMRRLPQQTQNFLSFHRDGLTGSELENRTLLVVGVGNVGYEMVKIGQGLGMRVLGVDLVERHTGFSYVSIGTGLHEADVILCAMNLTPQNGGYFDYRCLKRAKPGTVFVNVARGEHAPSADLLRLLEEGHLGGVGLDVFNRESELAVSLREGRSSGAEEVRATLELARHPQVILTPHNAFNTHEAVDRKAEHSARQIEHFLERGAFLWPVPPESPSD
jgi:D-lactate dehydrogenase